MSRTPPRRALLLVFVLALLPLPAHARPDKDPNKATNAADAAEALQQTSEGALRAFLASLIGADTAILRQVILPVSEADFQLLANARRPSDKDRVAGVAGIAAMNFRALLPGDTVDLPGGRTLTIGKGDVGDDHVLLQMPGGPVPVLVRRIKGRWYVDAAPIIAARRTAAEMSRKLPKTPAAKAPRRR